MLPLVYVDTLPVNHRHDEEPEFKRPTGVIGRTRVDDALVHRGNECPMINIQGHARPIPDLIDLEKTLEEDFPSNKPMEVGMPSPYHVEQDMSATITLAPGSDQVLTIEELQQQVSQLDATLTIIKQQLQQLM